MSSSKAWTAIAGGAIGAAAMAAILLVVAPEFLGSRLVRSGLMADPQILVDAGQALRDRQYEPILAQHRAAIETPFASSWKGSAKPDVTVVEFYDYACTYCKASNPDLERLIKEDPGVRVVYREFPILGPESVAAARLSLTASKAGRFVQFHDTLWKEGRPGPQTLARASAAARIAPEPVQDAEIEAELQKNYHLAGALGASGTPLFVIGERVINSAVGYDELKKAVDDARKKAKG